MSTAAGPAAPPAGLPARPAAPLPVGRRDVLVRPAAVAGTAAAAAVALAAVLARAGIPRSDHGVVWSVAAAAVLVLAFSGLTGWLMTAVAAARPELILAVALGSYVTKVSVFGVAAAAVASLPGFAAPAFAAGGTITLVSWLVTEAIGVLRAPALLTETFQAPQ